MNLAFVDVPGHERFVKNMLAGAGGIDLVMLIVAADESVMPQTREHFQICRLLQVPAGVIVLTKADVADADMIELARIETRELVAGSFLVRRADRDRLVEDRRRARRAPPRADVRRVGGARARSRRPGPPADRSRLLGQGLRDGRDRNAGVRTRSPGRRAGRAAARADGQGPRPAGPRPSGRGLRRGAPRRGEPRRRSTWPAWPGETRSARRGHSSPRGAWMPSSICCPMRGRCGTARACGSITARRSCWRGLPWRPHGTETGLRPRSPPGRSAYARIRFEAPAVLTRGDRFIVRAYSPPVTIGGGVVLDPHPPRSAIRNAAAFARYRRLDAPGAPPRTARSWRSWTSARAPGSRAAR